MRIIEPIAATANTPLARPSANTDGFSGQDGPTKLPTASASSIAAEATQPITVQVRSDAARERPPPTVHSTATTSMPSSTPAFCVPDSLVDSAGVMPKIVPANGSRIRSWAL